MSSLSMRPRFSRLAVLTAAIASPLLVASSASAGIYLSLRPVAASLPAGATVAGSDLTGYTLTLPTSAAQQSFQYDLVVRITQGTTTSETGSRAIESLFGAVRTSSSGSVTGNHVANPATATQVPSYQSPAPSFQIDPTGQLASSPQGINPFMIPTALPGTNAPFNYGTGPNGTTVGANPAPAVLGIGPQFNNFARDPDYNNSIPQVTFQLSFAFGGPTGIDPYAVPDNTAVVVARAIVNLTSNDPNGSATFTFVGGNGANGTDITNAWATWSEGANRYSTYNFNPATTAAVRNPLIVNFDALSPATPGDYNGDGFVDSADYTVWADHFGQTGSNIPGDGNNDGVVDSADYTVWADHFGQGTPPGPVAIPEPTAFALTLPALTLLRRRR